MWSMTCRVRERRQSQFESSRSEEGVKEGGLLTYMIISVTMNVQRRPTMTHATWRPSCRKLPSSQPPGIAAYASLLATDAWAKIPVRRVPTTPDRA